MDDLLREAIADAKSVRETALANAKIALEEAFTPRLQSMLSKKIQSEMEDSDEEMDADEMRDSEEGMHDKEDEEEKKKEEAKKEAIDKRVKDIDVKEDVNALVNGESELSEVIFHSLPSGLVHWG